MRPHVQATALPAESRIARTLAGADFADSYCLADPHPELSPMQSYLALVARTPGWMHGLMALRNRAVRLVGLKDLGSLSPHEPNKPAEAYRVGDRVGIFRLNELHPKELILGDDDRHLRVQVSLYKAEARLWLSTVVHEKQALGRLYMSVVGPVHRLIVPRLLAQTPRRP